MLAIEARRALRSLNIASGKNWSVAIGALIIALIVLLLMQMTSLLRAEVSSPSIKVPSAGQSQQQDNWFSIYPQTSIQSPADTLQVAALDARLLGVVRQGQSALANIAVDGKNDRLYKEGDALARGVVLERIGVREIVVRESGVLRKIEFPAVVSEDQPLLTVMPESVEATPKKVKVRLQGTTLFDESGIAGFRLDAVPEPLQELGLVRAGDVVVAVDGRQLAALATDRSAVGDLLQKDSLQVSIVRGGSSLQVDVRSDVLKSLIR